MTHFAIEARNLCKVYGEGNTAVKAMCGVSFKIARGEVVALLGPSGAGKSTILTTVGLINPPTSGTIYFNGELAVDGIHTLVDVQEFRRTKVGFVFQKANLIPFLTAKENVQLAMELNDASSQEAASRATSLLEGLGIAERMDNYPPELSGGQQQRVAIARALINKPELILADEPTAALDSQRGRQVMELFSEVANEHGTAVMVVTHDHRALDVFDRLLLMEDGVLEHPTPERLAHFGVVSQAAGKSTQS